MRKRMQAGAGEASPQAVARAPAGGLGTREGGPVIVLVSPQLGENVGAAARAMANFGLSELRLVAPRDGWPNETARANASGADWVIDGARLFADVGEAVSDLNFVCATTARPRDAVKPVLTPELAAREMRARALAGERCGVLFGPERTGLANEQVTLADAIVTVPTDPTFASLNLAQSVLILAYEWLKLGDETLSERRAGFAGATPTGPRPERLRPATRGELIGFFEHLEGELDASGFLRPPEKRPSMTRNIRNMFLRLGATDQDVRTLRGIVAALARRGRRQSAGS